jgi:uncharacterized protein YecE (DUF72 family)
MLHLGCSGYSYADWVGPFYPRGTKPAEMLEVYAQRFRTVEINSTYYRLPGARTFEGMARRVGPDFRFSVKLPGDITHKGKLEPAADFLRVTRPLADSGKLACVLAQFPFSFKNGQDQRGYLARLAASLPALRLVVEFRHVSWQAEPVYRFLGDLGLSVAAVDAPDLPGLPRGEARAVGRVAYLRFHGRNAGQWFEHDQALEESTDDLFIYFNNHFEGKAPANALQLAELLGKPLPMAPTGLFS